jgi:hypothetical protein
LGIEAGLALESGGYTVVFSLPRKLICEEIPATPAPGGIPLLTPPPPATRVAATTSLNVTVYDNDETARTWSKSWAPEASVPAAWAKIQLIQATQAPAGGRERD